MRKCCRFTLVSCSAAGTSNWLRLLLTCSEWYLNSYNECQLTAPWPSARWGESARRCMSAAVRCAPVDRDPFWCARAYAPWHVDSGTIPIWNKAYNLSKGAVAGASVSCVCVCRVCFKSTRRLQLNSPQLVIPWDPVAWPTPRAWIYPDSDWPRRRAPVPPAATSWSWCVSGDASQRCCRHHRRRESLQRETKRKAPNSGWSKLIKTNYSCGRGEN